MNPKTYPAFTKATGIQVKKDFYTSNEALFAKLKGGARGLRPRRADRLHGADPRGREAPRADRLVEAPDRREDDRPEVPQAAVRSQGHLLGGEGLGHDRVHVPLRPRQGAPDDLASVRRPREDEVLGQGHRARRHPRVRRLDARDARATRTTATTRRSSTRRRRSSSRSSPTSSRSRRRSTSSC